MADNRKYCAVFALDEGKLVRQCVPQVYPSLVARFVMENDRLRGLNDSGDLELVLGPFALVNEPVYDPALFHQMVRKGTLDDVDLLQALAPATEAD